MKKYYQKQYGIPIHQYDDFIRDFDAHRSFYVKFNKKLSELNPDLLKLIIQHQLYTA